MNKKWINILLVASLALNLAFVSTLVYRKLSHHKIEKIELKSPVENIIENDLDLKNEQKADIKKIMKQFELKLFEYKQNILDQRIAIIEGMSDPDLNLQDIDAKTTQLNKLENELNLLFVDTLIQVNALLEPQQRLNFLYKLSKPWFFIPKKHMEKDLKEGGPHD
jgi:Spy/CpxP family protein refolding chaperone